MLEVLDMVGQEAGRPIPYVLGSRRPGDLDRVVADNRRLKERLAWRPRFDDLCTIVTDALRWEARLSSRDKGSAFRKMVMTEMLHL